MNNPIRRAADNELVVAAIESELRPRLKPTKANRVKLVKSVNLPPKPKKVPVAKRKKILEAQLEAIVKQIVHWRDASTCVLVNIDGGRCGGKVNWGHFIPRARSKYLKYDLATFIQCDSHNLIHDSKKTGGGDPIFGLWFTETFGIEALRAMSVEQRTHLNADGKVSIVDLEAQLAHYDELYQNRFYVNADIPSLVAAGYYGEIVRVAALSHSIALPAMAAEKETERV